MNAFLAREDQQALASLRRSFSFTNDCVFGAIQAGHRQIKLIDDLNRDFGKAVYYLLYNPPQMPFNVSYPLRERIRVDKCEVGCRVFDSDHVHQALSGLPEGTAPTFGMVNSVGAASNWSLEMWAADMLLTCQVGKRFEDSRDERVRYLLERRSGPIGAALAASITLPDE